MHSNGVVVMGNGTGNGSGCLGKVSVMVVIIRSYMVPWQWCVVPWSGIWCHGSGTRCHGSGTR